MNKLLLVITILIISITVLNVIDFPIELRFENTKYNYLFVSALSILLPLSVFLTSFIFKNRSNTCISIAISVLLSFPCTLVYFFASSDFKSINDNGIDYSFEKVNEVNIRDSYYRLYRTNGGATTAFGLVLRKESKFIKGLKLVKVVFNKHRASASTLSIVDEKNLKLHIEPYTKGEKGEVITLGI